MACRICSHPHRAEIESAILDSPKTETLQELSKKYDVDVTELQAHACMHSPLGVETKDFVNRGSITREAKTHEVDMLMAAACNYANTIEVLGTKISKEAEKSDMVTFSRNVARSTVDLYLGAGGELRNTIKEIANINAILNGPKDSTATGLEALANAIRESGKK